MYGVSFRESARYTSFMASRADRNGALVDDHPATVTKPPYGASGIFDMAEIRAPVIRRRSPGRDENRLVPANGGR